MKHFMKSNRLALVMIVSIETIPLQTYQILVLTISTGDEHVHLNPFPYEL